MNKMAVALAADSAVMVSLEDQNKIYNTANKLFSLSMRCPVGLMVYGNGELNGIPWETIIKIYKNNFFTDKRKTLKEYANDFISFLNDASNPIFRSLFPITQQEKSYSSLVSITFLQICKNIDDEVINLKDNQIEFNISTVAAKSIEKFLVEYSACSDLECLSDLIGENIFEKYKDVFLKNKEKLFDKYALSEESNEQLMRICTYLAYKDKFVAQSGVVIAGFGENEVFPSYESITIEAVLDDRLKYKIDEYVSIDFEANAYIVPFAENDFVKTFMLGIDPNYELVLRGLLENMLTSVYPDSIVKELDDVGNDQKLALRDKLIYLGENLNNDFWAECLKLKTEYYEPIHLAIGSLQKDELAAVAESLVGLASAKKRMSLEEETIGGPCDVAIISRGDGFIWIKRKRYFETQMNPQYISKFFRD
jgi:hypothetical protein